MSLSRLMFVALLAPTPIQCYDWNGRFCWMFYGVLSLVGVLSFVLITWFVMAPQGWWRARPYLRILLSSVPIACSAVSFAFPFALRILPGVFSYLGLPPDYLECVGNIPPPDFPCSLLGVPAISQPFRLCGISLGFWASYVVLLSILTWVLARVGWRRRLRGLHQP